MKSKSLTPDTYPLLLKRVRETLVNGQRRIIEEERVRTYKIYPRLPIVARGQQFSWSHYRNLLLQYNHAKKMDI